jgi:hypothetical protein
VFTLSIDHKLRDKQNHQIFSRHSIPWKDNLYVLASAKCLYLNTSIHLHQKSPANHNRATTTHTILTHSAHGSWLLVVCGGGGLSRFSSDMWLVVWGGGGLLRFSSDMFVPVLRKKVWWMTWRKQGRLMYLLNFYPLNSDGVGLDVYPAFAGWQRFNSSPVLWFYKLKVKSPCSVSIGKIFMCTERCPGLNLVLLLGRPPRLQALERVRVTVRSE